ncbi:MULTISPECIES: glutathione S-transferase family protein [unclassified Coleofasciculus]|uniref:glutathione S-transferase family protein n=1 Tax=unclassified Coleofasciculus TaxID=2692782 RepID=UPI001881FD49|nr:MULTISPECIES: glutathione S-transferase family protein [unclassified Coleofasciculus]MBE9127740.1 glutathione S-transferase family protein [Coleofasciculus sp. LEGE 07081]MBE9150708.1 glutathione S-transferase family protein [Coleofasciculus sp. LEGE 07092]
MATGMLVNGKWTHEAYQQDEQGRFLRNPTKFRHWVRADGSTGFTAEAGRYHLYVSLACPWAHRTLIMRKLKGLEDGISLSIVDPFMDEEGWEFSDAPGSIPDRVNGARYLREVYIKADPNCTGRVTVPILWDKETNTIVNNESREIIRMFDREFEAIAHSDVSFYSENLGEAIDQAMDAIYQPINNGVYRAGFATTQNAYEEAVTELFKHLDYWEAVLDKQRYMCGDSITEADWCMFTTLLRFDPVYYVHFKCNWKRIVDYPNLWNYLKDLYQQPGVKDTCNLEQIKQHYYKSHPHINPSRIIPKGPEINFEEPHNRG